MQAGKLPPALLARLLEIASAPDPRVIVGPRVGEDAAAIDLGDGRVLVLKADPISYASARIGWYAVHINANDVATMGARPSFFLATLLLPEGFAEEEIEAIFRQLTDACREVGATLVGGHTEVTPGLAAPVLSGAMIGEVERDRLILTAGARPGDRLILTKGIAVEGSALLANDFGEELLAAGVPAALVESGRALLDRPGISVVPESRILRQAVPVHAMHDPTEGGLAGAAYEVAAACGCGLVLDEERIPVLAETRAFADALGLDPLRMLGSGALLAAVPAAAVGAALAALAGAGIAAAEIGEVAGPGDPVILKSPRGARRLEAVPQDEVARFLASRAHRDESASGVAGH